MSFGEWFGAVTTDCMLLRNITVSKEKLALIYKHLNADSTFGIVRKQLAEAWILKGRWAVAKQSIDLSDFYPAEKDVNLNLELLSKVRAYVYDESYKIRMKSVDREIEEFKIEYHRTHGDEALKECSNERSAYFLRIMELETENKKNYDDMWFYRRKFEEIEGRHYKTTLHLNQILERIDPKQIEDILEKMKLQILPA